MDQLKNAFARRLGHLKLAKDVRELLQGLKQVPRVAHKRDQGAERDRASQDVLPARDQDDGRSDAADRQHHRQINRGQHRVAHAGFEHRAGAHLKLLEAVGFAGERLGRLDAHDRLVEVGRDLRVELADRARRLEDPALKVQAGIGQERHYEQHQQGELPV